MRFHPNYPTDNNKGQRQLWHALKSSFERDDGIAYYRYPIFAKLGRGRSEPDFLLVHRQFGIWILECKGCQIGNIRTIDGHDWQMRDWYSESMSPVCQVEGHMFEVKTLIERDPALRRLRLPFEYRVVLPFVTKSEWRDRGHEQHPSVAGIVWLDEDISEPNFRKHLQDASAKFMPALDDQTWARVLAALRGEISDELPRSPIPGSPPTNYSRIIHAVESRLKVLDEKQDRIAQEVPEGPQRLRGLAGTGKTVLFARRIAQMHASHPEWDIAFVYWSRSLSQQIRDLVEKNFRRLTGEEPNWAKLHVWHAWGGKEKTGFYKEIASHWGCKFLDLGGAKRAMNTGESPFEAACRVLETDARNAAPALDAIIIDEGQDLPGSFYRVAYHALRDPKRLYWAYDEAQGVDTLIVPRASDIFGRTDAGAPVVDLSGTYPSGIRKAHNLNRCYRTPREILMAAHAINMGLLRQDGPLQGVTSKQDWEDLGYEVVRGDFSSNSVKSGAAVVLERPLRMSGHPMDDPAFDGSIAHANVFVVRITKSEYEDVDLVVGGIQKDLESGLRPEDIAVVCLDNASILTKINDQLSTLGIATLALNDANKDGFRKSGHVTLSSVRRAKGNEAYKVYALNLHLADPSEVRDQEREMVARNQVFVALTRTKLWCVAIGRDGPLMHELQLAADQRGSINFKAFNQASLRRSLGDTESRQMGLI